jgi:thiamine kinase-like enzyme
MSVIQQIATDIPEWRGKRVEVLRLSGGLTNENFKLIVDGAPFFVRVPGESTELLAIDRENEHFNAAAAAAAGVGPRVLHYLPKYKAMVLEFLDGRTMSNEGLSATGMPARIAEVIRRLHAGPRFLTDFDMFRLVEYYLKVCEERHIRVPEGYGEKRSTIRGIEQAMLRKPPPTVPCHNDLLAENYMEVSGALRLIDYEYSGNNDPYFELGNTCQELKYNDEQILEVCTTYFGEASSGKIARLKLSMIMSDAGWALWAAIQAEISKIEYDFWGWATERWDRATAKMDSSSFGQWLEDVQV